MINGRIKIVVKVLLAFVHFTSYAQIDEQQIKDQSSQFSKNYIEGNFVAMAEAYTTDAVIGPPSKDIVSGREKIYNYWAGLPKTKVLMHRSETITIKINGDEAHDYGYYYTQSQKDNGEKNPVYSAKYYIIWKKVDGTWKMKVDIWNSRDQHWNKY
ncbi:MAG: nuclear transport factor 2 family protein [Saprospiraceae bacterium]|nr:nuclear transport factor 2 family protein [Saprospiraceae bacterium]